MVNKQMSDRWDRPQKGALGMAVYKGAWKDIEQHRGIVEGVARRGDGVEVGFAWTGRSHTLRFDPDGDSYGAMEYPSGDETELYEFREVVPPSQVKRPGVEEGDTVKVKMGSAAYRVEEVDRGMVHLEDDRRVPVTHITAFDEDVDDYDPLNIVPGDVTDILPGGFK